MLGMFVLILMHFSIGCQIWQSIFTIFIQILCEYFDLSSAQRPAARVMLSITCPGILEQIYTSLFD